MTVLKNVGIWIEGIDIAGVSNSVGLPVTAATPESTTFKNDGWMDHEAGGLKSSAISYAGYVPLSDIDREMFESLATKGISTIAPIGNAPGNVAYVVPYVESEFAQSGAIGELLAFTFSAAGDNAPYRAQVFDVREGIAAAVTTPRRQLGAIPSGQTLHLWTHVAHNAGILEIDLFSAASAVGGTVALQARRSSIAGTGLYVLSVDGPVTDEYWEMVYTPTGATPDFDISAATFFAAQNFVAVPLTPPITAADAGHGDGQGRSERGRHAERAGNQHRRREPRPQLPCLHEHVRADMAAGEPERSHVDRARQRPDEPEPDRRMDEVRKHHQQGRCCGQRLGVRPVTDVRCAGYDRDGIMRVLVACEFSGIVRDAFIEEGHDAISCDLLPSERSGPHIQSDVRPLLKEPWDMVIAHPPCQFLTNARSLPDLEHMGPAIDFFVECLKANAPKVAVENPTMFKIARRFVGEPAMVVEPFHFGDPYKKRTCFWLKGLTPLMASYSGAERQDITSWVEAGSAYRAKRRRKTNHFPRKDRTHRNAEFFPGMAVAMAQQWGGV